MALRAKRSLPAGTGAAGNERKRRPTNRYELISCALADHVIVGTDVATLTAADALLAVESEGIRFYRCLRCDSWVPDVVPAAPSRPSMPGRDEIALPLRGPMLRDRYVLRLIAIERAVHVVVLTAAAIAVLFVAGHERTLAKDYDTIMADLFGGNGARSGLLGDVRSLFTISKTHLHEAALVLFVYAGLEATEMVGLWLAQRWAEYLTFTTTTLFIPFEIYELVEKFGYLKLLTFILNVAISLYLLLAKRLFGLRGGYRAERERRRAESGWPALERAGPPRPALDGPPAGSVEPEPAPGVDVASPPVPVPGADP